MAAEEDDSWIYDSVVGFLNSPIWMVPIESFVDQNCLVFDGSSGDSAEYTNIHSNYKLLVEELLESFTNDLHITTKQFIGGCQKGRAATSNYTQGMFEYVFASVNFELFKNIMVRHNASLSLQALQMIRGGTAEGASDLEAEVMKFSEQEYKAHRAEFDASTVKEMADLEAALVKSRLDCETLLKDIEKDKCNLVSHLEEGKNTSTADIPGIYPEIPDEPIVRPPGYPPRPPNTSTASIDPEHQAQVPTTTTVQIHTDLARTDSLPPLKKVPPPQVNITETPSGVTENTESAAQKWMEEAKSGENVPVPEPVSGPSEQSLEERRQYWLKRKQEIVDLKKKAALETLKVEESQETSARPKSARVAKRVLKEGESAASGDQDSAAGEKYPAMSQALADALRREVVNR